VWKPKPIQPIIETVSETLALEVKKTFDFYRATAQEGEARFRRYCSRAVDRSCLVCPDFLAARFDIPVEVFDPFRRLKLMHASLIRTTCARSCQRWQLLLVLR
jgi:hypothetical protein